MTIYFYKVQEPYGCFSNFSPHQIVMAGHTWPTVEHYYQAQKFVGTPDERIISRIQAAATPEEAAALGRDPQRILRSDWEKTKINIMRAAVFTKFLTHQEIQTLLLSTGNQLIVEDSPTDYFWGCGADHLGQNHLGQILMSVRQEIWLLNTKK